MKETEQSNFRKNQWIKKILKFSSILSIFIAFIYLFSNLLVSLVFIVIAFVIYYVGTFVLTYDKKDPIDFNNTNLSSKPIWQDPDTNLIWQVELEDETMTWYETFEYAKYLNEQKYGGIDTWKVPTVKELFSIHTEEPLENKNFNISKTVYTYIKEPLLNSMNLDSLYQDFWSASEFEDEDFDFALYVEFGATGGNNFRKDYECYVRCVSDK